MRIIESGKLERRATCSNERCCAVVGYIDSDTKTIGPYYNESTVVECPQCSHCITVRGFYDPEPS